MLQAEIRYPSTRRLRDPLQQDAGRIIVLGSPWAVALRPAAVPTLHPSSSPAIPPAAILPRIPAYLDTMVLLSTRHPRPPRTVRPAGTPHPHPPCASPTSAECVLAQGHSPPSSGPTAHPAREPSEPGPSANHARRKHELDPRRPSQWTQGRSSAFSRARYLISRRRCHVG
jgi:hypothetical protein